MEKYKPRKSRERREYGITLLGVLSIHDDTLGDPIDVGGALARINSALEPLKARFEADDHSEPGDLAEPGDHEAKKRFPRTLD